jgi:regulatory protein
MQPSSFIDLEEEPPGCREAMDRAGAFLAYRARSEREVRDALDRSGYAAPVIEATIAKLQRLDLIDDRAFSRQWIQERGSGKGLGRRRLLSELRLKGVDREVSEAALEQVGLDEEAQAKEVAARLLRKVTNRPLAQQAMRLQQMLLGRGFDAEIAASAVRSVLPPEGWD